MGGRPRPARTHLGRRTPDGTDADLVAGGALARPAAGQPALDGPASQRRSMRMIHLDSLVLADLPVDRGVVLEQQERTGKAKRTERALPDGRCSRRREHVFVKYERQRTESGRTCVRTGGQVQIWRPRAELRV